MNTKAAFSLFWFLNHGFVACDAGSFFFFFWRWWNFVSSATSLLLQLWMSKTTSITITMILNLRASTERYLSRTRRGRLRDAYRDGSVRERARLSSAHGVRIEPYFARLFRVTLFLSTARRHPAASVSAKSGLGRRTAPRVSHPRDNQPNVDEGGACRLSCLYGGGSPQG